MAGIETISYIKIGNQEHPIDAVTINGLTLTSAEKQIWNQKQDALIFDSIPTENSDNIVKSGDLYTVIIDNEEITASALNDLNDRLYDLEHSGFITYESDPVFSSSVAASISASDITNWNSKTSNIGTLTDVKFNGTSASISNGIAATPSHFANLTGTSKVYIGPGESQAGDQAILDMYLADSSWSQYASRLDLWYNYNGIYKTS